jgi:L-serine dehydratase
MESINELFRIGHGPSSSHVLAPRRAAEAFQQQHPSAACFKVTLYGSLAATGKGHLTDTAIQDTLAPYPVTIVWEAEQELPLHPNGMRFEAFDSSGDTLGSQVVYSVGGGALLYEDRPIPPKQIYDLDSMATILARCEVSGQSFWEYVQEREGQEIWDFLNEIWQTMRAAIERGIQTEGVLPGGLGLARKAWAFHRKASTTGPHFKRSGFLSAYALAVAEENAAGGMVVTAPTCGSAGVLPATLRYVQETVHCNEDTVLHGLATAGLIGNLVKRNASISGAEVGCQGEIGTACAMAAGAAAQLFGGTVRQIEYAAEMGLEHFLGLTCDPVQGLVQIPCIERNAIATMRALSCADYALFSDGSHRISFDEVVAVLDQTGHDLPSLYRETANGGLAEAYRRRTH